MAAVRVERDRAKGLSRTVGLALVVGLIGLWVGWWVASSRRDSMVFGTSTWVPPLSFLAGDFKVHVDHVARLQAAGVDPYRQAGDWVCALYPYPPMVARSFAWVALVGPATAARLWQVALASLFAGGAVAAWRTRRVLGLSEAVLFSTPAVFAMERGQSDPMVILPLGVSAWLLARRGAGPDLAAGALLGATAWLKYYPGLAAVALLALGRSRALAAFVAVAALIGVVDLDGVRRSIRNGAIGQAAMADKVPHVHETKHSLVENWPSLKFVRRSRPLRQVPGAVAAAALLLPAVVAVSRQVARSADPGPVLFPYLLWLTAAATFGMPYANDYNLVPLPLAILATWDRRDPWPAQVALGVMLAWWQPFWLPMGGPALLGIKLAGLYAAGACLAARANRPGPAPGLAGPHRPASARVEVRRGRARPVSGAPAPGPRPS